MGINDIMRILMTSLVDLRRAHHNRPHQFVRYLSKNHEVTVITVNDWWKRDQQDLDNYRDDFSDILNNINHQYITERKISPFLQEFFFRDKIRKLSKTDFDVHLNYNSLITGFEASKELKTVFDMADDIPHMIHSAPQIPFFLRNIGYQFGKYYLKKNIKNANIITLTNDFLGEIYDIPEYKMEILPNGVDLSLFKYIKDAKEILSFENEFIIGYVGVLREWVNLKPVFESLKLLNFDAKILIVGKEGYFEENIKLAKKCGVSDKVIFTGTVPYSNVHLYISAMDVCIIPFHSNSIANSALPLKLFEYMACGKPVIASPIPSIKKICGDHVLYSNDTNDYKENIERLYKNPKLQKNLEKAGQIISKKYNWEFISKNLEQILLGVI